MFGAVAVVLALLAGVVVLVSSRGGGLAEAAKGVWLCTWTSLDTLDDVPKPVELTIGDDTWELRDVRRSRAVAGTWSIVDGRLTYAIEQETPFEIAGVPDSMVEAFSGVTVSQGSDRGLSFEVSASNDGQHIELVNEINQSFICDRAQ